MSAGARLRGVRKGKTLAVDSTMLAKRSVSPDGRIDPLSKVSLDPGVQSAPHGAIRCNTTPRKTLMFWHVDAGSIPLASRFFRLQYHILNMLGSKLDPVPPIYTLRPAAEFAGWRWQMPYCGQVQG